MILLLAWGQRWYLRVTKLKLFISSSHIITRRVSTGQYEILRDRDHIPIIFSEVYIDKIVPFYYELLLVISDNAYFINEDLS